MKKIFVIILASLLSISSAQAQNTEGTEFWLSFGCIVAPLSNMSIMEIRIVGGSQPTLGKIDFNSLGTSHNFSINPYEIYTYSLNNTEMEAVYNVIMGISDYSVYVKTDKPVTVYALNKFGLNFDVTNVLPVTALGTEYYQISYGILDFRIDAYTVVATQNNTLLYHNGTLVTPTPLDAGEVYYRTSSTDMTGAYITSNNPVAFFATHQWGLVPFSLPGAGSPLFQQLAPVHTWGKKFFVPVTLVEQDVVRIVASQNGTKITQTGGTIQTGIPGAQTDPNNLQAGEFIELFIDLADNGCFIEANKPVGVCSYIKYLYILNPPLGINTSPSQAWVPGVEQTVSTALMAPFTTNAFNLSHHYALVYTPTATKDDTEISIGGAPSAPLSGGSWYDNVESGMSFYNMPLTNHTASYVFSNPQGLIIWGYGTNDAYYMSYYYLAYSAMRNLTAGFYANDVYYLELPNATIYCGDMVHFRAEIEGLSAEDGSLTWFIDGIEWLPAKDQIEWNKTFAAGEYEIEMRVVFEDYTTATVTGTLKVKAPWIKMRNYRN